MAVVKLTLNDEYYQMLKEMADAKNKSIQDYIRDKIFLRVNNSCASCNEK